MNTYFFESHHHRYGLSVKTRDDSIYITQKLNCHIHRHPADIWLQQRMGELTCLEFWVIAKIGCGDWKDAVHSLAHVTCSLLYYESRLAETARCVTSGYH